MAFRLRTIEFTAGGRKIVRDRDLDQPQLTIGRSAENDIHLPDLAVDPAHARLVAHPGGALAAVSLGTLGFGLDGVKVSEGVIDPVKGGELRFGTYTLTITRDGDGAVLVTIAQLEGGDDGGADDEKRGFSLARSLPGKRIMSWGLALMVLAMFLAWPVVSQQARAPNSKQTVAGDAAWSAGKLSLAHHALEQRCEACHVKPFEAVRDSACLTCHTDIHDHAAMNRTADARAAPGGGAKLLRMVADAFGKPGPGACTTCHTEHEGAGRMERTNQQFCADCHATLKSRLADTRLGDAGDFGTQHPEFAPGIVTDPFSRKTVRVSLGKDPHESNGLTFPHKLHLARLGGVARMAASIGAERGYGRSGLQCQDCHHPSEDGVRFKPVDMERDCEGCHSLAYDQVGGTFRTLRHGDVDQMVADLRAGDISRPVVSTRQRPGEYAQGGAYHFNYTRPAYTSLTVAGALSRDGVCGECHTPSYTDGRPGVMPVTQVSRFMKHGWFDHKPHRQTKCTTCHTAEKSSSASDLLLPGINSCRTCHLGEDSKKAEVPSGCAMCHSYHPAPAAPRKPGTRIS